MVSQARPESSSDHSSLNAGATADAENHTPIASSSAINRIEIVVHFTGRPR